MSVRLRTLFLAPVLGLLLVASSQASTVEDATAGFVAYQFDGGSHHDAPDGCASAGDEWSAPVGALTDGMLAAPDDVSDVFLFDVPPGLRGQRLDVRLAEPADLDLDALELTAFVPGCGGSVLDLVNWPAPEPSPPAPAEGERQFVADVAEPAWSCHGDQRWFWAEIMPGHEPAGSIHVAWTDGSERTVPLAFTHGGAHALYATDHALGTTLKGAWMNMPASWPGRFAFAVGPCDAVDGGAVYGEPPVAGMGFLSFTPVQAGRHVVQVTYRDAAGEGLAPVPAPASVDPEPFLPFEPADAVHGLVHAAEAGGDPSGAVAGLAAGAAAAQPTVRVPGPVAVPMSCHGCVDGADDLVKPLSYRLSLARTA